MSQAGITVNANTLNAFPLEQQAAIIQETIESLSDGPDDLNLCIVCNKPAKLCCRFCVDSITPSGKKRKNTQYCSRGCRAQNRRVHINICINASLSKCMFRAGEMLQDIFYAYREKIFETNIAGVGYKDGAIPKMYIYEGGYKAANLFRPDGFGLVQSFPSEKFATLDDKHAALVHMASRHATAWMVDVVKFVLAGLAANIEEVTCQLQPPKRQIVTIDVDDKPIPAKNIHSVFKVTLKRSGEVYALDLTSAQHGYYQPVMLWRSFLALRFSQGAMPTEMSDHQYLGGWKDFMETTKYHKCKDGKPTFNGMVNILNSRMHPVLISTVKAWMEGNAFRIVGTDTMSPMYFETKKQAMLDYVILGLDINLAKAANSRELSSEPIGFGPNADVTPGRGVDETVAEDVPLLHRVSRRISQVHERISWRA